MEETFVFYPSFYLEPDDDVSEESCYRVLDAILRYGVFGEKPNTASWKQWERKHFQSAQRQIDASKERYRRAKMGGDYD